MIQQYTTRFDKHRCDEFETEGKIELSEQYEKLTIKQFCIKNIYINVTFIKTLTIMLYLTYNTNTTNYILVI